MTPVSISILLIVSLLLSAQSYAQGQSRSVPVIVEALLFEQRTQRTDAVGSAEAKRSVALYPAASDRVVEMNIVTGQWVEEGDVLVRLDARRQQVAVDRAKIQLQDAERTVERLITSREREAIPQSELDDAVTRRDLYRVALTEAEADLEDRKLRAPFDGVVGLTDVEVGDRINEQTLVTTIDDRSQLLINFRAPENALPLLQQAPLLTIEPWHQSDVRLSASLAEVDSRVDSQTRTVRVRALLENQDDIYRPGASFRIRVELRGEHYAAIPEAALMWGATGAYVWVAEEEQAQRVDVEIKQRLSGRVLVGGDLYEGQWLITEGVQTLRSGQPLSFERPTIDPHRLAPESVSIEAGQHD